MEVTKEISWPTAGTVFKFHSILEKERKQAGAELCQAQEKLGLANPTLPSKKLLLSSI